MIATPPNSTSKQMSARLEVDMLQLGLTFPKTNMAIENPPFEDVFHLENGDFPLPC